MNKETWWLCSHCGNRNFVALGCEFCDYCFIVNKKAVSQKDRLSAFFKQAFWHGVTLGMAKHDELSATFDTDRDAFDSRVAEEAMAILEDEVNCGNVIDTFAKHLLGE